MHYQYEVTFGLYVLTPTEKLVLNTIVLSLLSLLLLAAWSYLPALAGRVLARFVWLYTGVVLEEKKPVMGNATAIALEGLTSSDWTFVSLLVLSRVISLTSHSDDAIDIPVVHCT